jgi:putative transposase
LTPTTQTDQRAASADKTRLADVKALLAEHQAFLRPIIERLVLQELLEAEMTEALAADKGERLPSTWLPGRLLFAYLVTRVGKLELCVPQDRHGGFSTELFERYQRSEKALVAALAEMYVQGVWTRKVKAITEEALWLQLLSLDDPRRLGSSLTTRWRPELCPNSGARLL